MSKVETLAHKGKNIIYVDLTNSTPEETVATIREAIPLIGREMPKSALILTNVTGATYNKDVASAIKDFVSKNTPFVKASAVVGADGVREILLQTVILLTRREIKTFASRESAMDWLVTV